MKLFYWFTRSIFNAFFYTLYRHQVYGLEHIPKGPAIIAPNHASFFDPPIIAASCPEEVYFLARKSLFEHFFLGTMIKNLNAFPVNMASQDLSAFKLIFRLLQEQKKVVIFPEGIRTLDGDLSKIKPGIGMICMKSRSPVIPVYIHGAFGIWPRNQRLPKITGKTACVFGTPLKWEEFSELDKKSAQEALAKKLYDSIFSLRKWFLNGAQGQPP